MGGDEVPSLAVEINSNPHPLCAMAGCGARGFDVEVSMEIHRISYPLGVKKDIIMDRFMIGLKA